MAFISKIIQAGLIFFIRGYRLIISGLLGHCCRFEPTCSAYAIEAIQTHGCLRGCCYIANRLIRCHPWHAGGVDLVPKINHRSRIC